MLACIVVATAGHVDHGKSTLVQRLTGMWPDRLAEEQRRGLTIDLGFAWTELDGRQLAFVDVPGHERFVANMLAGVGPVPAVMFVVAATEGWMPQSEEHLAALDALGVRHGLLVISKADLADPDGRRSRRRGNAFGTSLADRARRAGHRPGRGARRTGGAGRPAAARPTATPTCGCGSTARSPSAARARSSPARSPRARSGWATSSSTPGGASRVRGLQSLGRDHTEVAAVARVAVNLRGVDRQHIGRGDTLRTPGAWLDTAEIDVALRSRRRAAPPARAAHRFGGGAGPGPPARHGRGAAAADAPLPLRIGDIGLLRDPGEHRIAAGIEVLDVRPPRCAAGVRRGPGRRSWRRGHATPAGTARAQRTCAPWVSLRPGERVGDWVADPQRWAERRRS